MRFLKFFLILLCLFLAGCPWIERRQRVKECKFKIQYITPSSYTLSTPRYLTLTIKIAIYNPNEEEAILEPFEWRLFVEGEKLVDGKHEEQVEIPSSKTREITFDVQLDLWRASKSAIKTILNREAKYRMEATVYLSSPLGEIEYEVLIQEATWSTQKKDKEL